ncbi:hypothetical protein A5714_01935 [Mycobacterium sp. E2462]|uniref:hypothetical protein n=1 Tax=Mycobacterium sp. E2462 TaxID=1834133 RepID=UPI0007FF6254|nr:hypothetical protein [Mycobacterium sp. E2462]OBI08554.1 hypothetical protein A5714_01935 [Mycobacterium sp. E2462]
MALIDDLPDPMQLGVDDLRRLRDLFHYTAEAAVRQGDEMLATWARTITDKYAHVLNERASSARALRAYLADRRRERPHGTPGDTSGLPLWRDISGLPENE